MKQESVRWSKLNDKQIRLCQRPKMTSRVGRKGNGTNIKFN